MNQLVLCHFQETVNEKFFQFSFVPGVTNFDDIYAALDAFRTETDRLKVLAQEAEAKVLADKAAEAPVEEECVPCEPVAEAPAEEVVV